MQIRWLGVVAALIAAYGAGLYYEQVFAPAGCCALTWPNANPLQAERILGQVDARAVDPAAQEQAAVRVLNGRPGDPTAWLRLAYADWLTHGRLTAAGQRALDTSYLIAPYGGAFTPWRISLALNNWSALPQATRQDAVKEVNVALTDYDTRRPLEAAVRGVGDPSGRLAAALLGLGPARPAAP
ncbi:MAG: O-antigen polymerase [Caulobacteraceae bacterium]|nr:O-antigen polymerase [Caulobacteraceae bacterium]